MFWSVCWCGFRLVVLHGLFSSGFLFNPAGAGDYSIFDSVRDGGVALFEVVRGFRAWVFLVACPGAYQDAYLHGEFGRGVHSFLPSCR